jgi:hypothetical protein
MPMITQNISKEYLDIYDGYDKQEVGLGLLNPNIYATKNYQKKKIKAIGIGMLSKISYGGAETDASPLVLPMAYEPQYSTILAYNMRYATPVLRRSIMKFILEANAVRIKSKLPIMVDYYAVKRAIPDSQFLVRRYKVVGVSVMEAYQLNDWPILAAEKTPFDGYYKKFKV